MGKISVIIPTYNVENVVGVCIESVRNQTYQDLEIIIVDDGSTDGTLDVIKKYADYNSNIIIIRQKNLGPSAARNVGIHAANGEYIFFVDGDDWLEPDCLEKLLNRYHQENADVVECGYFQNDINDILEYPKKYDAIAGKDEILAEHLRGKISFLVWNKLYRTELIREIKFEEGAEYEDVLWTCKVLLRLDRIVSVRNPLYHWRVRLGSISRRCFDERHFKSLEHFYMRSKILEEFQWGGVKCLARLSVITECYFELRNALNTEDKALIQKAKEHSYRYYKSSLLKLNDFLRLHPIKSKLKYVYYVVSYIKLMRTDK